MDNPSPSSVTGARAAETNLSGLPFFSTAGFGLVVLCFFLNFFEFRCKGSTVASVSGMDLALGNEPHTSAAVIPGGPTVEALAEIALRIDEQANGGQGAEAARRLLLDEGMSDAPVTNNAATTDLVKPNGWAIAALVAALAGIFAHLLLKPKGAGVALVLAAALATALFILYTDVRSLLGPTTAMDVGIGVQTRVETAFGTGYWGAWLGCVVSLIASLMRLREHPPALPAVPVPPSGNADRPSVPRS